MLKAATRTTYHGQRGRADETAVLALPETGSLTKASRSECFITLKDVAGPAGARSAQSLAVRSGATTEVCEWK